MYKFYTSMGEGCDYIEVVREVGGMHINQHNYEQVMHLIETCLRGHINFQVICF
jgi:hypothetical protein